MARSRQQDSSSVATMFALAVVIAGWMTKQPTWVRVMLTVSVCVVVVSAYMLFRKPTNCGVANRTSPRPCGNPVRGMLAACHLPDHRRRKRKLILARLRGRKFVEEPMPAVPATRRPGRFRPIGVRPTAQAEPVTSSHTTAYWVQGSAYHVTMLISGVLGGLGGVAGVASTVHSIFV